MPEDCQDSWRTAVIIGKKMLSPKKYQGIAVASILIILSLIILSLNLKRPGETGFFRKLVMEIAAPVERGINSAIGGIADTWRKYIFLFNLEEENRALKKKVEALTSEINARQEVYLESMRLKELLGLKDSLEFPSVAARVIGRENSSVFKTILINKGTASGLAPGMPVIAVQGVVGRVIESSWHASRVLLLVDYNSNIDAVVQAGRTRGILQGGGVMGCTLKYVEKSEELKAGDLVVTSGIGGIFPRGMALGTVVNVEKSVGLFQKVDVLPAVALQKLEEVLVIMVDR